MFTYIFHHNNFPLIIGIILMFYSTHTKAQKTSTYFGVNFGAGFFNEAFLFPYENSFVDDVNNNTGEIQIAQDQPTFQIGLNFDIILRENLNKTENKIYFKANLSYQQLNHTLRISNNDFSYSNLIEVPFTILQVYATPSFNTASYRYNSIITHFLVGYRFFQHKRLYLSFLAGPQMLININGKFDHSPQHVINIVAEDLESLIGKENINRVVPGVTFSPQINYKINNTLHLTMNINAVYYFSSLLQYNKAFDEFDWSPFKENTSISLGGSINFGLNYKL